MLGCQVMLSGDHACELSGSFKAAALNTCFLQLLPVTAKPRTSHGFLAAVMTVIDYTT
jgi:hypothetical protein